MAQLRSILNSEVVGFIQLSFGGLLSCQMLTYKHNLPMLLKTKQKNKNKTKEKTDSDRLYFTSVPSFCFII